MGVTKAFGNKAFDTAPDEFSLAVTEQGGNRIVGIDDQPGAIDQDQRVGRLLDDPQGD